MTDTSFQECAYARQSAHQRKNGGGVGRSEKSWRKHEAIERAMGRQLPVLAKRGRGLIVDLHAGDGKATPHRQPDFFAGGALITTPHLALSMAARWGADVWLYEKSRAPRLDLQEAYGERAEVMGNHRGMLNRLDDVAAYPWVMVLCDPNGHGKENNGVEVMEAVSTANRRSDFIVVVNRGSILRHQGVGKSDNNGNQFALAVEATKAQYAWMLTPELWAQRLRKRQYLATAPMRISNEMTAQVVLISNFIPGHSR